MQPDTSATRRVEFVLDLVCVHSYLAFARFELAAERRRAEGARIEVSFLPFQIAPDAPTGGEPLSDRHRRDFGSEAGRMTEHMAAVGARQDRAEPMAERLFRRAYFSDGLNIGDPDTLERVRDLGVRQVPLLRFDSGAARYGAQSEEDYVQELARQPARAD